MEESQGNSNLLLFTAGLFTLNGALILPEIISGPYEQMFIDINIALPFFTRLVIGWFHSFWLRGIIVLGCSAYLTLAEYKWDSRFLAISSNVSAISLGVLLLFIYILAYFLPLTPM